jgi:hypothetical protein
MLAYGAPVSQHNGAANRAVILISPSHRVSIRLSFSVSVYIVILKHPRMRLDRREQSADKQLRPPEVLLQHRNLGAAAISPQTYTHFSQYFTGLHNLAP